MLALFLTIEPELLQLAPNYKIFHSFRQAEIRQKHSHMKAPTSPLYDLQIYCAGPLYNNEGVLLHVGATIIWSDGRRANFQCGFDQALTQYLEVWMQTADAHCHSMNDRTLPDSSPVLTMSLSQPSNPEVLLQHRKYCLDFALLSVCVYACAISPRCSGKMHAARQSADVHTDRAKLLTMVTQVAGTHGTVRLDDFVIPYRPDKASFLVTNNHGFTDLDLAVKTETEERVVCTDEQPSCKMMVKHDSFGGKVITCCAVLH